MKILGIETSCDETAVSVLEVKNRKIKILSNIVSSQVKLHAKYGGVVPHLAAREHEKNLPVVLKKSLKSAEISIKDINLIAVTVGPGLAPALWRGVNFAKELAEKNNKPIIGADHLKGHIYSNWFNDSRKIKFPLLNLIVSGGHTLLVLMKDYKNFKIIGETLDDAAGEAFDKVARLLKLGYPGGPIISRLAEKGNPDAFKFPRPMIYQKNFNFSFSGLKTAVLYLVRDLKLKAINYKLKADICASFQQAVIDVLISKTLKVAEKYKVKTVALSGGVSANKELRKQLKESCDKKNLDCFIAPMEYTTDNAAMISLAGYFKYEKIKGQKHKFKMIGIKVDANLRIA